MAAFSGILSSPFTRAGFVLPASVALLAGALLVMSQNTPPTAQAATTAPAAATPPTVAEAAWSTTPTLESADGRLVSQPRPLEGAVALINRLKPKRFLLHTGSLDAQGRAVLDPGPIPSMGLIAQETLPVVPEAVYRPEDDRREFWMIDYERLVPLLVRSIQEQQVEIRAQATRIQSLESKVGDLETRVRDLDTEAQELRRITKVIDSATRNAFSSLRSELQSVSSRLSTVEAKSGCTCSK